MNKKVNLQSNEVEYIKNGIKWSATDKYVDWQIKKDIVAGIVIVIAGIGIFILSAMCISDIKTIFGL